MSTYKRICAEGPPKSAQISPTHMDLLRKKNLQKIPITRWDLAEKSVPGASVLIWIFGQTMDTNRDRGQTEPPTPSPAGWPAGWPAEWPAGWPAVLALKIDGFLNDFNKKIDENIRKYKEIPENIRKYKKI